MVWFKSSSKALAAALTCLVVAGCAVEEDVGESAGKSRPSEWAVAQRLFPHWRAEPGVYVQAAEQARALPKGGAELDVGPWQFVGPDRVAGRVVDLEYNLRNPDSVYAAAATGGVFLSTDGGLSWAPIFDDQPVLSIGDIAVDPVNPSVVYVGTGEANGGHNNLPGAGLFKSVDGGKTWVEAGLGTAVSIARVVVDPKNSSRVFAAVVGSYFAPGAERGVYRSEDAGGTWTQILTVGEDVGAIDLVAHPTRPDTLYAAMWQRVRDHDSIELSGSGSGVHRSYDGGDTWTRLGADSGLPDGPDVGRIGLAICESHPEILYALVNDGSVYTGTYRTEDGGDSWQNADPARQVRVSTSNFSWYFGQIRVNPDDPDDVYVLDVRLARSRNGGQTWSTTASSLHVDFHALAFRAGDVSQVLVGNDGGIGLSRDAGTSWLGIADMPTTQFYEVAVDLTDPNRIFGGTQDNGTIRRDPENGSWTSVLSGDGFAPLIHPLHPDTVYLQGQWGTLKKSVDGGNSSVSVVSPDRGIPADDVEPRNWSTPVAMDPSNPEVLYYGTNRVYRTDNGALTWEAVSPVLPVAAETSPRFGTVTAIAVSQVNPSVIWAGTDDGRVWVTRDPKTDWQDVTTGLPERWVTEVAADPADDMTAYVTFSGLKWRDAQPHVFRTTDGGVSWEDISSNLPDIPVNGIAVDPQDPSLLFVATDLGVFASGNGGQFWTRLDDGMPMVAAYDLDIHQPTRTLFVSTHGRSMYKAQLPVGPVAVEGSIPALDGVGARLEAWPNPFSRVLNVKISGAGWMPVEVFDLQGRRIHLIEDGGGAGTATWDATFADGRHVQPGVYFLRSGDGIGATLKVVYLAGSVNTP